MNEEINFSSINELYNRLLPALKTKQNDLRLVGFEYLTCIDIWNFLKENKWKKANGLELAEMVSDIMNADVRDIDNYLKSIIGTMPRTIIPDETIL